MLELVDHRDVIRDLKFAPDESIRLLSASRDGTLKLWELEDDGNMSKTLKGNSGWVYTCAWSPDAKIVCSAGERKSVSSLLQCRSMLLYCCLLPESRCHGLSLSGSTLQVPRHWPLSWSYRSRNVHVIRLKVQPWARWSMWVFHSGSGLQTF